MNMKKTSVFCVLLLCSIYVQAENKDNALKVNSKNNIVFTSQIYDSECREVIKELIESQNEKLIKEFLTNKKFFERFTAESLANYVLEEITDLATLAKKPLTDEELSEIKKSALNWFNEESSNLDMQPLNWLNTLFKQDLLYTIAGKNSPKLNKFLFQYYYGSEKNIKDKTSQQLIEMAIEKIESFRMRKRYKIDYQTVQYTKDKKKATITYDEPSERQSKTTFIARTINDSIVWLPIESELITRY